jgi:threonine/homoserine/homoserine lactone efflux protein
MISSHVLALFVLTVMMFSLAPGPNMVYCVSRAICQGRNAGMISLTGVALGYAMHISAAVFGLTALLLAVPLVYDAVKLAGAAYLLWMAWQVLRSNNASPFEVQKLPQAAPANLFLKGFLTNVLNPKLALFYVSLFPQFVDPAHGNVLMQSFLLGFTQISISVTVDALFIMFAAVVARFFVRNPLWSLIQRWVMSITLTGLALRLAIDSRN